MTPYIISDFNHFGGLVELFLILTIDAHQNVKKSSTIFTMMFAAKWCYDDHRRRFKVLI